MNWPFRRESVTFAWSKIPPLHSTFFHSSQIRGIWSPSMNGRLTSPFLTHRSNIYLLKKKLLLLQILRSNITLHNSKSCYILFWKSSLTYFNSRNFRIMDQCAPFHVGFMSVRQPLFSLQSTIMDSHSNFVLWMNNGHKCRNEHGHVN